MPSARGFMRETTVDAELEGRTIPAGSRVFVVLGAANQDPDAFGCPHAFDLDRPPDEVRASLAFGIGVHKCIGAPLARLESVIAVERVLTRLPNLRLVPGQTAVPSPGFVVHCPQQLEFTWDI
jgi:cytochrome P450